MSKRRPFAKLRSQGFKIELLHAIGTAALARVYHHDAPDWFAAKHGPHHAEGHTPAQAITGVRKAREAHQKRENEVLLPTHVLAAFTDNVACYHFIEYNGIGDAFAFTRAELRNIVTAPSRKAHNWATYRDQLAQLGIRLSRPNPT